MTDDIESDDGSDPTDAQFTDEAAGTAAPATDGGSAAGETGADGPVPADDGTDPTAAGRSLVEYLQWAVFGILVLVLLISTVQFYNAANQTINTFVTDRYRAPFKMAFNLALVLACGLGLSVLVRRMR